MSATSIRFCRRDSLRGSHPASLRDPLRASLRASLRWRASRLALLATAWCAACSNSGGDATAAATTKVRLERVQYGRLVDVYGLGAAGSATIELFERDVVIGSDIEDQRQPGSTLGDEEVTYDFLGSDPSTLQPRLLITRAVGSAEFAAAFARLDDRVREVEPMRSGPAPAGMPFPVVPRNAAIRLVLSAPLSVGDDFFVERRADGVVTGLKNTEAVQLLRIAGDPTQPGAFVPLPVRVIAKPRAIVLDPVLLGDEGAQYQTLNRAAGMPASTGSGANIRVAIALEGPLALPGLRPGDGELLGRNNSGRSSVVRDFRSGNANDESSDLARGFVRDPLPLHLIGEIPMFVERVEPAPAGTFEVTIWKGGARHEIDRGDVFRFLGDDGVPIGTGDVVEDPSDDLDHPEVQYVRVRVRPVPGLSGLDPRLRPDAPGAPAEREAWLRARGVNAICIAEFTAGGEERRDDPANFLTFTPAPVPLGGVQPAPNEFVSPFAGAVVRFSKPVDMATVRWADTLFFAMRDLTDEDQKAHLLETLPNGTPTPGLLPAAFTDAKYRTPYLIGARVADEDGSQTSVRLQPTVGFYLDDTMRDPPPGADYRYFLHLISHSADGGIRDLAGNALDLQGTTAARANSVVLPFSVDTRRNGSEPNVPDNLVVSVVWRFAGRDEDANPSWFRPDEVQPPTGTSRGKAFPLDDLFGAFVVVDGYLRPRPTSRTRVVADNLNQAPVVAQPPAGQRPDPLGWCPQTVFNQFQTEDQRAASTAGNIFPQGIQNPLNPFGCRLQTLWRDVDLSLSRTDPFAFDLDIEGMYWAPFTGAAPQFDEFDAMSLWLSSSEFRPAPCTGEFSALPSLPDSGLRPAFARNVAWNPAPTGAGQTQESQSPRVAAYVGKPMVINPASAVREPTGINRYLALPEFQKPYFTFRDETSMVQGCDAGIGSDLTAAPGNPAPFTFAPYIVSPFLNGQGRRWVDLPGPNGTAASHVFSYWNDATNFRLGAPSSPDPFTGGLVGSIALPLLADFWTTCDSSEAPIGDPYVALGVNGWQVSVTLQSSARPNFRVYSGGRPAAAPQGGLCMDTGNPGWSTAAGGWQPGITPSQPWTPTVNADNTLYWVMLDVLRRQSVITSGFVDLLDPHRVPEGFGDPRLGPFWLQNGAPAVPADVWPEFAVSMDPPASQLPAGTSVVPQFRAAGAVDPSPWYWNAWISASTALFPDAFFTAQSRTDLRPTAENFPNDPLKAGDAHIRKWDQRNGRNWWTYFYNRHVTRYVENPNELMQQAFTAQHASPTEPFTPHDVRYVNWRFVVGNNTEVQPPVEPAIDTFVLSYRFVHH